MQIRYSKKAIKALRKTDSKTSKRLREKIGCLANDRDSVAANIKPIKGTSLHRLRVGDWRVTFTDKGEIVTIVLIKPRGEIYKR